MDSRPEPERPDLTLLLPRDVDYQIIHTLCATLPPITDTPADLIRRDNAEEANVATTYAAARAHAMDCLLLAREHAATDHGFALKCGTQTASMLAPGAGHADAPAARPGRTPDPRGGPRRPDRALRHRPDGAGVHRRPHPATAPTPPAASPADIATEADQYALAHR
jgi:hypothetical protein